jgi:hypothetical protein
MESELRAWIKAEVDLTLAEICARLAQQAGIQIRVSALWHQLDKWNLTLKKTLHASEREIRFRNVAASAGIACWRAPPRRTSRALKSSSAARTVPEVFVDSMALHRTFVEAAYDYSEYSQWGIVTFPLPAGI